MRKFRIRKGLALLMSVSLMLQITGGVLAGFDSTYAKAAEEPVITYYVGGSEASDTNDGIESGAPFSTFARAIDEINLAPGNYEIILQGNTAESRTSQIGNGTDEYNVTVKTTEASAMIRRNGNVPGDFIVVSQNVSLTLGENNDTYSSVLTIDGGRTHFAEGVSYGNIIKVASGGSLVMYDRVTVQNIYRYTYSYNAYGGAINNAGTFDMYGGVIQLCYASYGAGVYNTGTFKLYGGTIQENGYASYGSGVYNTQEGTFEMHGGRITNNRGDSYAGGVGNAGTFLMIGGSIDNNYANSNGGVYNRGTIIMTGGAIDQNRSDYSAAGILNTGEFYLSGGSINENRGSNNGGGVYNFGYFSMTGGIMENNSAGNGGALYNYQEGNFAMAGGILRNNTADLGGAVYNAGAFSISGDFEIPEGTDSRDSIHLVEPLTLAGDITGLGPFTLSIDNYSSSVGGQWLKESEPGLIASNWSKFYLLDNRYSLNNSGYVEYDGRAVTYYVGGTNASDENGGTQEEPFATLQHALEIGNDANSIFILQSDQVLNRIVNLKGNITILTDGTSRTITKSPGFPRSVLFSTENCNLTLGNPLNSDTEDTLIFDGLSIEKERGLLNINEASTVNIYNGVTVKNFDTYYPIIINYGTLNFYGGSFEYNSVEEDGIILNLSNFYMMGGTIRHNNGIGVYNSNYNGYFRGRYTNSIPVFEMSGGSIYANTATIGGGIYNEGQVILSGSAAFPKVEDIISDICLARAGNMITIGGDLSTSEQIVISKKSYIEGDQVLTGEAGILWRNYNKFILLDPDFSIKENGYVVFNREAVVYYVNASGNDSGAGSINDPFKTINKASQVIGNKVGTIFIQSDININEAVTITGTVTLLSDGNTRTIRRGDPFNRDDSPDSMFFNKGKLILGSPYGNDLSPDLYLYGNSDSVSSSSGVIIWNEYQFNLNPGVVLYMEKHGEENTTAVVSLGHFHMYGGSISDRSISDYASEAISGVLIYNSSFTMEGGTIQNCYGEIAGLNLYNSTFIMKGGSIRSNTGFMSGIVAYESSITISAGSIEDNIGDNIAGLVNFYDGFIRMTGGSIRNNNGMVAGVALGMGSTMDFSGGSVGGNTSSLFASGVFVDETGTLILSGRAVVDADNLIMLQESPNRNTIKLKGPIASEGMAAKIAMLRIEEDAIELIPEYTIGRQLLESYGGYPLTQEDISKISLADEDYGINPLGRIGKALKNSWLTLNNTNTVTYDGKAKSVEVEIRDGETVLAEGVHYTVHQFNNVDAGRASVIITGIGNYAGIVPSYFTIGKANATKVITASPADQRFLATDRKTAEQLLQSIALHSVEVAYQNGTAWLPVVWRLTEGSYHPMGGTYTYTGTIQGNNNITANGLTLTAKIVVDPVKPYLSEKISLGVNNKKDLTITYISNDMDVYIDYQIDETVFQNEKGRVQIPISTKELLEQLKSDQTNKLNLSITLPSTILNEEDPERFSIILDKELIKAAKAAGKDITISVKDENGKEQYSWTFSGKNLKNSLFENTETELALKINGFSKVEGMEKLLGEDFMTEDSDNGFVIRFEHEGELPSQASLRIYVGNREGIKAGSRIYLYYYNPKTKKLETLPGGSYLVDEQGYITVNILHCSDYVVLYKEAGKKQITSLRNQINVTVESNELFIGVKNKPKTTKVNISLPKTLELVNSIKTPTTQSAVGGVTVTYRSTNEAVAIVDKKGIITAKGKGIAFIETTMTLYNGKVKTERTIIVVKDK